MDNRSKYEVRKKLEQAQNLLFSIALKIENGVYIDPQEVKKSAVDLFTCECITTHFHDHMDTMDSDYNCSICGLKRRV